MIVGGGYGYGRALGAQGYGFAYDVTTEEHHGGIVLNRRRIHEEEEEFIQVLAIALPLIVGRLKWRN